MKRLQIIGLISLASIGAGCSGMAKTARALAKDPATVLIEVNTPYGKQKLTRIGGTTNTVEITPDGKVVINPAK